jgi:hypothetical protein
MIDLAIAISSIQKISKTIKNVEMIENSREGRISFIRLNIINQTPG